MHATRIPPGPPRQPLYANLIHWAKKPGALGFPTQDASSFPQVPIQALLYVVASEWLIMAEYIKSRLGQIELEISYAEQFLKMHSTAHGSLEKLHTWRRLVPEYREMLNETLEGTMPGTSELVKTNDPPGVASGGGPEGVVREVFTRMLSQMEAYELRIDRLTSLVIATISLGDSQRSLEDNRNFARLTWLATFFIPLTFISGLFSMQEKVLDLGDTLKLYAKVAVPLAFICLGFLALSVSARIRDWMVPRKWRTKARRD